MLERLSPVALKCFDAAKQEARQQRSAELNVRHLLLGLIQEQPAWMGELLKPYNVTIEQVMSAARSAREAQPTAASDRLIVSIGLKDALRSSVALAQQAPVTPTHLLLSMLEGDNGLRALLQELGVDGVALIDRLRTWGEVPQKERVAVAEPVGGQQPTGDAAGETSATSSSALEAVQHRPTPSLDRYGRDLTNLAREGQLHPIVGREREIAAIIEILCRTMKRNPILVGEPGVGKTALAEGLAQRIIARQVPPLLQDKRLVELSVSALVAGAGQVGEFEKRLNRLVDEVRDAGDVVLFIDEAHALLGAGGAYGLQDAATILKPALARGDIVCISSTTTHEYRKYIEKDGALARRFQPIRVEEPAKDDVLHILRTLRPRFEVHFQVTISDALLDETYELSKYYLKNRYFPDKAIDLLERTASRVMLSGTGAGQQALTTDSMLSVLSDMTGIPLENLDQGEMERYLHMEDVLRQRVIGQDWAVEAVSHLIRLTKRRLDLDPRRPDGVFLFVGPPGVGKTELVKALTQFLFGDEERLIRLDMSEFSAEFTVSRLIGSPPGYVGFDQGGQLTEQVLSQPFCVLLLDEMEQAHPAVLNLFLQVFDDGRLTDAQGRTVYFSDATIVMTSNLASELWFRRRMGFGEGETGKQVTEKAVMDVLRRSLPGDLLSRIDEVVIFEPLSDEAIVRIAESKLETIVRSRFARQKTDVTFDPQVVRYVADRGYDPRQGCRGLERVIQREVLEPLAELMYQPDWQDARSIVTSVIDGQVTFARRDG